MELRPATPEDADTIAGVVLAVAHHAYAELEPRRVALMELDDLRAEWAGRLRPDRDRATGDRQEIAVDGAAAAVLAAVRT